MTQIQKNILFLFKCGTNECCFPFLGEKFYQNLSITFRSWDCAITTAISDDLSWLASEKNSPPNGRPMWRVNVVFTRGEDSTDGEEKLSVFEESLDRRRDVIWRGMKTSWFECLGGSGVVFWRWLEGKINEARRWFEIHFTKTGLNKTKRIIARSALPKYPRLMDLILENIQRIVDT